LQFPSRKGLTDRFAAVIRLNHRSLVNEENAVKKLSPHNDRPAGEGTSLSSGQWAYLVCTVIGMRGRFDATATGGLLR